MSVRNKVTTEGGSTAYKMVRSKFTKGKDGYGKVISAAREKLIKKSDGKDPGENTVAMHKKFGSHFEKGGGAAEWGSRAKNTAESNKHRKSIRSKVGRK